MTSPYERNREIAYAYVAYMQARVNKAATGPERVKLQALLDEGLKEITDSLDDELKTLLEDSR
jgi:hypothetical protein